MDLPNTPIGDECTKYIMKIYEKFGMASYATQCIEKSLINILILFDFTSNPKSHNIKAYINSLKDKNGKLTMGKLINHFKEVGDIPIGLESLLDQTCKKRNLLNHNYLSKHDLYSISIEDHEKIIIELESITILFIDTLYMLNLVVLNYVIYIRYI